MHTNILMDIKKNMSVLFILALIMAIIVLYNITFNEEKFKPMEKFESYFNFLIKVKKNTFNANNLFVIYQEHFSNYLGQYISNAI